LTSGAVFQVGGCSPGGATALLNSFNPCGVILNCQPDARVFNFVRAGIDEPGLRPEVDPFCTFPPFCTQAQDPIFGGLSGP